MRRILVNSRMSRDRIKRFHVLSNRLYFKPVRIILPLICLMVLGNADRVSTKDLRAASETPDQIQSREPLVSAVLTDCGAVMNGERRRSGLSVRPFLEDWTGFVTIKNTGTAFIGHFQVTFSCPMKKSKAIHLDLISPAIPSFLWKPFAGDMLSLCTRSMDFTIKRDTVEMRDASTGDPISVVGIYPSKPLTPAGLPPGASVLIEYTEPYSQCVEGFMHSIAERENLDIKTEVVDPVNNIMHMLVKEFKVLFLTFDDMKIAITFKGAGEHGSCSLDLSIDDKLYSSIPWVDYEWK